MDPRVMLQRRAISQHRGPVKIVKSMWRNRFSSSNVLNVSSEEYSHSSVLELSILGTFNVRL